MENNSDATVFQIVGTGLKDVSILDAAGTPVKVDTSTHFQNENFKSLSISKLNLKFSDSHFSKLQKLSTIDLVSGEVEFPRREVDVN